MGRGTDPDSGASRGDGPAALRRALLAWYDAEARPLPWRERPDPYGVWISEIMLQQTTMAAAVPYWERFLERFPDVRSLADASEQEVLTLWAGLGYYRRARSLHAAARMIVRDRGGDLPRTAAEWRLLPGVGAYTAGAVASIAAAEQVAAVDTNARRVLLRLFCASAAEAAGIGEARLRTLADSLVDPLRPGDWNQALMELGARICLPRDPRCASCPVGWSCRARSAGDPGSIPEAKPRARALPVRLSVLLLRRGDSALLTPSGTPAAVSCPAWGRPRREDFSGLFAGFSGLPTTPWYPRPASAGADPDPAAAPDAWSRWLGARISAPPPVIVVGEFRHAITVYRLAVTVCRADLAPDAGGRWPRGWTWGPIDGNDAAPVSNLTRKALSAAAGTAG